MKRSASAEIGVVFLQVQFDRLKRLVAQVVLDLAGVLGSDFGADTDLDQKFGQYTVTFNNLGGKLATLKGEVDVTRFLYRDKTVLTEKAHRAADTRLGVACVVDNIYCAYIRLFFLEQQDGFQIHFGRFIRFHFMGDEEQSSGGGG